MKSNTGKKCKTGKSLIPSGKISLSCIFAGVRFYISILTSIFLPVQSQGLIFSKKFTRPGPVSTKNLLVLKIVLLVLNIGMKEIQKFEHKINLLVTE